MKIVKPVQPKTMQPLNETVADFVCRGLNCGVQIALANLRYAEDCPVVSPDAIGGSFATAC